MATLVLKLVLTPLLIAGATLAGRRWGGAVSGWIVGLPLTSGPVSFFLTLEHGRPFATRSAVGSLAGVVGELAFFAAWAVVARRGWALSLALGSAAFAAVGAATQALGPSAHSPWPLLPLAAGVVLALALWLRLLPSPAAGAPPSAPPARWDLPARAAVATGLVFALTALAGALGARLTGLLAVYPLYSIVLAVFAQRAHGADAAVRVLRGVVVGLFAFTAFFLALALLLPRTGTAAAYVSAAAAALVVQMMSLRFVRAVPAAAGRLDAHDVAGA